MVAAPVTDDIETRIRTAHTALKNAEAEQQEAERAEAQAITHADNWREQAQRRRIDLGHMLREARTQWPERGPTAKGWGDFLRRLGIHEQSAREWMQLAEYAEVSKPSDGGLEITRREVQAAQRGEVAPEPDSIQRQKKRPAVLLLNRRLCDLRLRASLVRLIEGGVANDELLRSALDVAEEARVFDEVSNDIIRWDDFTSDDRTSVLVEWIATLRAMLKALEAVRVGPT